MLSPFPVSPPETGYPIPLPPASMRVLPHLPTHSLLLPCLIILLHCINPSQDQWPLLPLMPNKAILCYICDWSHGSTFDWWFSPWELWEVWLIDIVLLMVL